MHLAAVDHDIARNRQGGGAGSAGAAVGLSLQFGFVLIYTFRSEVPRKHKSPLKGPQRILDVGTGTGIWAIDIADAYPIAEVIGIELRYVNSGLPGN